MLAIKLQQDEENHHRCQMELEEEKRLEEENQQRKRENQIAVQFERLQSQLFEDLRRQVVFKCQRRFQDIQLNTRKGPIEEAQKSFQLLLRTIGKESHETPAEPEPTVCWKCGEGSHKKKDCMAILFCTNCGRNNNTTSKCRQVFKENCMNCKQNDHTEECCPVKELDSMRQSQTREFHMYHNAQPRMQLLTEAPRIEEGEILRRNQHQRAQQTVERESTDKLTSYGQIKDQNHNKSTRIKEANISTALITSNSTEISKAMEKISETNHLMAQQQIGQQRALQALLLHQEQSNENQEIAQRVQTQALRALTDAREQKGFDTLFSRITKFDGKDPQQCHSWLNQVHVVCQESGRNF